MLCEHRLSSHYQTNAKSNTLKWSFLQQEDLFSGTVRSLMLLRVSLVLYITTVTEKGTYFFMSIVSVILIGVSLDHSCDPPGLDMLHESGSNFVSCDSNPVVAQQCRWACLCMKGVSNGVGEGWVSVEVQNRQISVAYSLWLHSPAQFISNAAIIES